MSALESTPHAKARALPGTCPGPLTSWLMSLLASSAMVMRAAPLAPCLVRWLLCWARPSQRCCRRSPLCCCRRSSLLRRRSCVLVCTGCGTPTQSVRPLSPTHTQSTGSEATRPLAPKPHERWPPGPNQDLTPRGPLVKLSPMTTLGRGPATAGASAGTPGPRTAALVALLALAATLPRSAALPEYWVTRWAANDAATDCASHPQSSYGFHKAPGPTADA